MLGSQQRKTVLWIVPSWFTLHYHLSGRIAFLRTRGFDIHVVSNPDPRALETLEAQNAPYYPMDIARGIAPCRDLMTLYQLVQVIRRTGADLIGASTKKGGFLGAIAAHLTGRPMLYVVRGLEIGKPGRVMRWLFRWIERFTCALADRILMISKSNLAYFLEHRICPAAKMIMLGSGSSNGVDVDLFCRTPAVIKAGRVLRQEMGIPEEATVLGFVGRLSAEKGIKELEQVWGELRSRYSTVHLLVVSPPEVDPQISMSIERMQADTHVHFTGFMPDPVPAYAAMDCLVLPSHSEGFGVVVIEAGAMQVPTVATRVPGCVDAVVSGQTGLLVDANSPTALFRGIERLLLNSAERRTFGVNARQRCVAEFSQRIIWQEISDLYDRMISDKTKTDESCSPGSRAPVGTNGDQTKDTTLC